MQIFFPSRPVMIALFFVLWFVFQAGAAWICFKMNDAHFARDSFLYRTRRWEDGGRFYARFLGVKKWKGLLPDGGALFRGGYAKKHLRDVSPGNLERYVLESRRAELTHWLAILPFWVFGLFAPPFVVWVMLAYALAANLPCIIAQRYNRPRVQALARRRAWQKPGLEQSPQIEFGL